MTLMLASYRAALLAEPHFYAACGSFLFRRADGEADLELVVGCIDPEFLFGEDARRGVREALAGGRRPVWYVTDGMLRGKKLARGTLYGVVLYEH
ncbi:hypothetical protein LZ32DRAFT_599730 [Colletotrichum eremochloae]|nr:hypothetical protein LZ32DRAFT_599730 [Colletotrichum eremochloae]